MPRDRSWHELRSSSYTYIVSQKKCTTWRHSIFGTFCIDNIYFINICHYMYIEKLHTIVIRCELSWSWTTTLFVYLWIRPVHRRWGGGTYNLYVAFPVDESTPRPPTQNFPNPIPIQHTKICFHLKRPKFYKTNFFHNFQIFDSVFRWFFENFR